MKNNKNKAAYARLIKDPVLWAETYLVNPSTRSFITLNPLQKELLSQTTMRKLISTHRRSGKDFGLSVLIAWHAFCNPGTKIALIAPDLSKITGILNTVEGLINSTAFYQDPAQKIKLLIRIPPRIQFANGSTLTGYSSARSRSLGSSLCGTSPDIVLINEPSYIDDDHWLSIESIISRPNVKTCIVGTPENTTGTSYFKELWLKPDTNYTKVHYPVSINPDFDPTRLCQIRQQSTAEEWETQWLATYPQSTLGETNGS